MRPETVALYLKTLRSSLFTFSIIIFSLNVSIYFTTGLHPKKDPDFPDRPAYICFPQENDEQAAVYMRVVFIIDIMLSFLLFVACLQIKTEPSNTKMHWSISVLSALRFICVLNEIFQVSSMTGGDTQLDIILSVNDGSCKLEENFQTVFNALVVIFVLRCVKGYFTICMGCLAYAFSILTVLYGSDVTDDSNVTGTEQLELAEIPVDTPNIGGPV